jgi:hypothetical protein
MPVFRYTGEPGVFNWFFTRGQEVELVFPMADLVANAYTTEVVEGVTLYTVTEPFDLTGFTFEAAIGPRGGTPVVEPVVTHNGAGGELTLSIDQATSEATPQGTYAFELVDLTSDSKAPLLIGTVRVIEGVLPR